MTPIDYNAVDEAVSLMMETKNESIIVKMDEPMTREDIKRMVINNIGTSADGYIDNERINYFCKTVCTRNRLLLNSSWESVHSKRVIKYSNIIEMLNNTAMGPVWVDPINKRFRHCKRNASRWLSISYTQNPSADRTTLLHDSKCCRELPLELNIQSDVIQRIRDIIGSDVILDCCEQNSKYILVWWDELPGKMCEPCNVVWPTIANMQYISQTVLKVVSAFDDLLETGTILSWERLTRAWPNLEMRLGRMFEGTIISLQDAVKTVCCFVHLMHVLLFDGECIALEQQILGFEDRHRTLDYITSMYNFFASSGVNIYTATESLIFRDYSRSTYHDHSRGVLLSIENMLHMVFLILKDCEVAGTRFDLECHIQSWLNEHAPHSSSAIEIALCFNVLGDIEHSDVRDAYKNKIVNQHTLQAVSNSLMFGRIATGEAFEQGDKPVAVTIYHNIWDSFVESEKYVLNGGDTVPILKHPVKDIFLETDIRMPQSLLDQPTISWTKGCHYENNCFCWPGAWTAMWPCDAIIKAINIMGIDTNTAKAWY